MDKFKLELDHDLIEKIVCQELTESALACKEEIQKAIVDLTADSTLTYRAQDLNDAIIQIEAINKVLVYYGYPKVNWTGYDGH
jgi:hypothetical protein